MTDTADTDTIVLPSDPATKKKIRDVFYEIAGAQQFIKDKKDYIKDCVDVLNETYKLPKKLISKISKIVQDHNYDEIVADHAVLEAFYDNVMDVSKASTLPPADDD